MEHPHTIEHLVLSEKDVIEVIEGLEKLRHSHGVYPYIRMTREERKHAVSDITSTIHQQSLRDRGGLENTDLTEEQKRVGTRYLQYEHNKLRKNWFSGMIGYLQLLFNERDPKNKDILSAWQTIRSYTRDHAYKGDPLKVFHAYTLERMTDTVKESLKSSENISSTPHLHREDEQEQQKELKKYIEEHYKRFSTIDPEDNKERFDALTEAIGALGFLKKSLGTETESFKEKLDVLIHVYFSSPTEEQMHFIETMGDWFLGEYKKSLHHTQRN